MCLNNCQRVHMFPFDVETQVVQLCTNHTSAARRSEARYCADQAQRHGRNLISLASDIDIKTIDRDGPTQSGAGDLTVQKLLLLACQNAASLPDVIIWCPQLCMFTSISDSPLACTLCPIRRELERLKTLNALKRVVVFLLALIPRRSA